MVSVNGATSWRWVDEDGTPVPRDEAAFQVFRIRSTKTGDLLGLVAVPPDTGLGQIALIAQDLTENLEDTPDPVRPDIVVNISGPSLHDARGQGFAAGYEAGLAKGRGR